jgi:hypothetical protein
MPGTVLACSSVGSPSDLVLSKAGLLLRAAARSREPAETIGVQDPAGVAVGDAGPDHSLRVRVGKELPPERGAQRPDGALLRTDPDGSDPALPVADVQVPGLVRQLTGWCVVRRSTRSQPWHRVVLLPVGPISRTPHKYQLTGLLVIRQYIGLDEIPKRSNGLDVDLLVARNPGHPGSAHVGPIHHLVADDQLLD